MRRIRLLLGVAGIGVVLALLAPAAPAQAHEICATHGNDVGCSRNGQGINHYWLDGCDHEPDGNRVRTNWKWVGNDTLYTGQWDENGADPGCANDPVGYFGSIAWHRACEENISCGNLINH